MNFPGNFYGWAPRPSACPGTASERIPGPIPAKTRLPTVTYPGNGTNPAPQALKNIPYIILLLYLNIYTPLLSHRQLLRETHIPNGKNRNPRLLSGAPVYFGPTSGSFTGTWYRAPQTYLYPMHSGNNNPGYRHTCNGPFWTSHSGIHK